MKKLLVLLFIISGAFIASSQNYLTVGQVYNFNVGDVFETESGTTDMGCPPIFNLTIVLAKWYSAHSDTVYYEDSDVDYSYPEGMICPGIFDRKKDTVYYTHLSSMAVQAGSYCPQTWDTLYISDSILPYCGRKIWEVGPDTACLDSSGEAEVNNTFSWVVQGCGGPYVTIYSFDNFYDIPYTDYSKLIYYKKNDTTCGTEFVITSVPQPKVDNISLTVYPNPCTGAFTLQVESEKLKVESEIQVFNVLGENVYNATLNQVQGDYEINLSAQPNGIYLYRVITQNGNLLGVGKLVIQR